MFRLLLLEGAPDVAMRIASVLTAAGIEAEVLQLDVRGSAGVTAGVPRAAVGGDVSLRRSEAMLAEAQRVAGLGSWELDLSTEGVWASAELCRILGLDATAPPATLEAVLATVHPEDRAEVVWHLDRCIERSEAIALRHRVRLADGSTRNVMLRARAVPGAAGRAVRVVGTEQDLTEQDRADEERARMQARMARAEKLESLAVLAGGIAHDFNNILVGIVGRADLVACDVPAGTPAAAHAAEIRAAGERAGELAARMLSFSGAGRFVTRPTDLNALLVGMLGSLDRRLAGRAEAVVDLDPDLVPVDGDPGQLRELVSALAANAAEAFAGGPGRLTLRTRSVQAGPALADIVDETGIPPGGRLVVLHVEDDGHGMDEETRERIFEPFFTTRFPGRGLGLPVALGIVRGHGGAIRVDSAPGRGCRVAVFLPCAAPAAVAPTSGSESGAGERRAPGLAGGTVLVVDDEAAVREVVRAMLERRGYAVVAADGGLEGVRLAAEHAGALRAVLLDLTMPDLAGDAVFARIRQAQPDLPVVLMSGYGEAEVMARFAGARVSGFLHKPFDSARLMETLGRV